MRAKFTSVALLLSTLLGACTHMPQSHRDMAAGEVQFQGHPLVQQAINGEDKDCCWIRIARGYDGERVREGYVYVTAPVSHDLGLYGVVHHNYYARFLTQAEIEAFAAQLMTLCVQGDTGAHTTQLSVYINSDLRVCEVEWADVDILVR